MRKARMISALLAVALSGAAHAQVIGNQPRPGDLSAIGVTPDQASMEEFLSQGPQGKLAIQVVQGTEGGPAIGDVDVEIDYYHNNASIKHSTAHLDENGVVVVEDVPLALAVRPVVRIQHAGVTYLEAGPAMDAQNPEAVVKLTAYEVTDDAPAWRVAMRHVMVQPTPEAAQISETLVVENPGDHTWMGGPADQDDRRTTVLVSLPEGAHDVHLVRGFHGWCCTSLKGRELAVQMPLMPGRATFEYSYHVPVQSGRAGVEIGADARIDSAVFIVPDDGTKVEAVGVQEMEPQEMGDFRARMYQAQGIESGQDAGIVLAGITGPPAPMTSSAGMARIVALVGGGAVACLIVLVVILRSMGKARVQTG